MRTKFDARLHKKIHHKHYSVRMLDTHEIARLQRAADRGHQPSPPFRMTDFDRFRALVMQADEAVYPL